MVAMIIQPNIDVNSNKLIINKEDEHTIVAVHFLINIIMIILK
jgi:hypothetical protein